MHIILLMLNILTFTKVLKNTRVRKYIYVKDKTGTRKFIYEYVRFRAL